MNLNEEFLKEVLKASVSSRTVLEIIAAHVKEEYIPDESYRKVLSGIVNYWKIHEKIPTLGVLQNFINDNSVSPIIAGIKDVYVKDKEEQILESLQEYIKKARLLEVSAEVAELYNKGKHDQAIAYMDKESKEINEFTLLGYKYNRVYEDYYARYSDRIGQDNSETHVPSFIPQFDHYTGGGVELGRSLLAIARSGVGKSFLLRQLAYSAAYVGYDCVHFQAEGTEKEIMEYFDSMWAGLPVHKIKYAELTEQEQKDIFEKRKGYLNNTGEIYVVAFEQFEKASIADCRRKLIEINKLIEKRGRKLGMVTFDYLEKFMPGDKLKYGATDDAQRIKKLAIAEKITNIATEFHTATATATQANNIPKEMWNDQNFVITREHIANLKATIDAFSYCITLNQTEDEDDDGVMRIHEEKQRNYKTESWQRNYKIVMDREHGWFVDIRRTKEEYWDDKLKKHIK